jgi:hypothetical protein
MHVHPHFAAQPDRVPLLVLYQLVVVNGGEFASPKDAETFGAGALGPSKDEYYRDLCALADELNQPASSHPVAPTLQVENRHTAL